MRKIGWCSFALLSALCASEPYWSFTQDTELNQSYSSLASQPIPNQPLIWGEVRGGSKDTPITLNAKSPLIVKSIANIQGEASGLFVDWGSHVRLVGELSFESISSSISATGIVTGLRSSVNNEANLTFKSIESKTDMAMGIFASLLLQKGTLNFENLTSQDSVVGIMAGKFDNQAKASITLKHLQANESVKALMPFLGKNSGSIVLEKANGNEVIGLASLTFVNEGDITFNNIQAKSGAVGVSSAYFINLGATKIGSITSENNSVGLEGEIGNDGEITISSVLAKNDARGIDTSEILNNKTLSLGTVKSGNLAIGIDAFSLSNYQGGQISVDLVEGGKQAIGLKLLATSLNEGEIRLKSITSSTQAIGLYGDLLTSKGASATFESIQAPKAMGIYQNSFSNTIGGGGKIVFENILGNQSYGIFIDAKGELDTAKEADSSLIHFKNIQSNVGIKNLGNLEIYNDAFIFAPSLPAKTNSAIYSDMQNGEFYLNKVSINTPYDYAFYANQDTKVYIQSSQATLNAKQYSFGGEVNLVLDNQAELTLQSGGTLKSLNASQSKLILGNNGYSKKLVINDFQAQNNTFTLSVDFERNQTSSYDGGAVYENGAKSTKGISSFLLIDSSKSTSKLENILSINLDSKSNVGKKYVLLAQVVGANKDNIVFNSLSQGQTTSITTSGRYTTNELLLGRYDDGSSNYYYLVADTFQAQDNLPSKPIKPPKPNPTPPQSVEKKEGHNALAYNPVESIMLSTLDWSQARFSKLRDDDRIGRVWAEFGAEYWKFDAKNSDESFVDLAFGGDYLFSFAKGKNALGIAVEVTGGFIEHTQFLGAKSYPFKIDSKILGLALYDVLLLDGGIYSNMSAKVGGGSSGFGDVNVFAQNIEDENLLYFSFSEQVGKRWFFSPSTSGMFVDFSATVAVGYAEGMSIYSEVDSMPWDGADFLSIATKPSFINQNKLEILLGYQSALNSFFSLDVNAGVGMVTNHCIGGSMQYENKNGVYDFDGVSYVGGLEVMANVVARFGNWIDAYVNIGSTWSKDYHEVVDFSTGVKLRFGTV